VLLDTSCTLEEGGIPDDRVDQFVTLRTYRDWEVATVPAQITLVTKSHA
jgi:hypothetical protein